MEDPVSLCGPPEVAALELGDIHWRVGEIVIPGRANRVERLPRAVDAGAVVRSAAFTAIDAKVDDLYLRSLALP